jgi:MoxR-like ATPase
VRIIRTRLPEVNERLAAEIVRVMATLRRRRLAKPPGVAETLDWAAALVALHAGHLDEALLIETMGCVVKDADDVVRLRRELATRGLAGLVEDGADGNGRPA